ncbi:flippase [Pseudodesulfovibrio methanolicus]|uniref:Flippase n=1 Tax=Pseudodesulfovibrio methanolicus TaxID=3126690 RepID=A0ABZ2ITN6_9BACT
MNNADLSMHQLFDEININTMTTLAGKASVMVFGLALAGALTRGLGEAGFGDYSVIVAWLGVTAGLADFGLSKTGVREMASAGPSFSIVAGNLFLLKLLYSLAALAIAFVFIPFMPYTQPLKNVLHVGLCAVVFMSLAAVYQGIFQIRLKTHFMALAESIGSASVLVLSWHFLGAGFGLLAIVTILVFGKALVCLLNWVFSRPLTRLSFSISWPTMRSMAVQALPLGVSGFMALVYFRLDIMMLSWLKPVSDVGIYGAAYRIIEVGSVIPSVFMGIIFPLLSKACAASKEDLPRHYARAYMTLSLAAIPMLVGGIILANPLMELITGPGFGKEASVFPVEALYGFSPTAMTFLILLPSSAMMFIGELHGNMMIAGNEQQCLMRVYFWLVPLNLVLNLLFIPYFSYLGAACATTFTEVFAFAYMAWAINRKFKLSPSYTGIFLACLASVPMGVVVFVLREHLFLSIGAGICVYAAVVSFIVRFEHADKGGAAR